MISNPTQSALFHKYYTGKRSKYEKENLNQLIDKYGGKEYLSIPEEIKDIHNTEEFIKYDINENNNTNPDNILTVRSIYSEDILINNHKAIYGSFYHYYFGWGFKCCFSFDKQKECVCDNINLIKENIKIIADFENEMKIKIEKEKESQKQKDLELTLRNEQEKAGGGEFSEIFNRMDRYESGTFKSNSNKFLGKKRLFKEEEDQEKEDDSTNRLKVAFGNKKN